ncbi:MAG: hypothetical protein D6722_05900 [Bacteroidetes bacterium]|nr:MAG: hypothetical protein D6722_05900 [Bacteroidota bacterium]
MTDNPQAQADPEAAANVRPLYTWQGQLGTHGTGGASYLVVLIRGDLLQKYPDTLVYAQKAQWSRDENGRIDPQLPRTLSMTPPDSDVKYPVLQGKLRPNISFFGFELDDVEAKGNRINNPGWFFVLKERPGQIRFGLDDYMDLTPQDSVEEGEAPAPSVPPTAADDWNDMSWGHLLPSNGALADLRHIRFDGQARIDSAFHNLSPVRWGRNAADLAYILFQNPVIFARHAQEILPD